MRAGPLLLLFTLFGGCLLERTGLAPVEESSVNSTSATGPVTVVAVTDASTSSGGGMGGAGGATTVGPGGAGGGGGNEPDPLGDDDVVVRYFLDEAAAGSAPGLAADAGPENPPVDITLDYGGGNLSYAEPVAKARGLSWANAGQFGVASAPVANTKISARLTGQQRFTVEVVANVNGAGSGGARLVTLGKPDVGCGEYCDELSLRTPEPDLLQVYLNDAFVGEWMVLYSATTDRLVVHVVFATGEAIEADRVRLYVDGAFSMPLDGPIMPMNTTLNLSADGALAIGNRGPGANRSPLGIITYAAIYDDALAAARVSAHSGRLKANDDATWP